ncbi:fumarylacetoacetate hydrolase family protein [Paenibacillus barcinonensis]|uniref:2-keto-4-pentenoate hydratase/2-oxohepta-3-ene-1,7-dioic acid hydratase in catechol pathway n=1 Tax=Paenibacillus barcinonensis TaxID=198119 RepID=A0A2V4VY05_PAEBA|nr:fumarylacetoacetate hydrolase family protein [Paenibacillus barcinonensis]PYE52394.1 2-keto-4-pentenoate hydratase/2-oxohepta-3-ene-1,7-dioic acid hydratase in catechol pathway [Paenibacillus barcinonensis]QKS59494.1 fumarylacetoacetate hydrolase family protein [Paenibacillus barcinonensis]
MLTNICNVYCVGRNYKLHAEELGNAVPDEPMIFMKPSHAVVALNGEALELPASKGEVHYEAELVIRIGRDYEPGVRVDELVDAYAFGIDFTLRDVQTVIKKKGHPWTAAKGFRNSAPITAFQTFPGAAAMVEKDFALMKNGVQVQRGNISNMIFSLQDIVDYVGHHYGLGPGDVIFTGTPEGVGAANAGDVLELAWDGTVLGACTIKAAE